MYWLNFHSTPVGPQKSLVLKNVFVARGHNFELILKIGVGGMV